MIKTLLSILLILSSFLNADEFLIEEYIIIKLYPYEFENEMRAAVMPELKADSELMKFKRRFEYLLINIPEIHLFEKMEERAEIGKLYPDTTEIKRLYLEKYAQDKRLVGYFEETIAPITNPNFEIKKTYTLDELMEVASKFFYCEKVLPDTSIQARVCVGLNGVKEANWEEDYTLLEAFCYEAIFNEFDSDDGQIWDTFITKKKESGQQLKSNMTSLNQYLEDVKMAVFESMKNDEILKQKLIDYYELNRGNQSFKIN
jgi:hypothetical protein